MLIVKGAEHRRRLVCYGDDKFISWNVNFSISIINSFLFREQHFVNEFFLFPFPLKEIELEKVELAAVLSLARHHTRHPLALHFHVTFIYPWESRWKWKLLAPFINVSAFTSANNILRVRRGKFLREDWFGVGRRSFCSASYSMIETLFPPQNELEIPLSKQIG